MKREGGRQQQQQIHGINRWRRHGAKDTVKSRALATATLRAYLPQHPSLLPLATTFLPSSQLML